MPTDFAPFMSLEEVDELLRKPAQQMTRAALLSLLEPQPPRLAYPIGVERRILDIEALRTTIAHLAAENQRLEAENARLREQARAREPERSNPFGFFPVSNDSYGKRQG